MLKLEDHRGIGHGFVLRLPFGCGVSFWGPSWGLLIGAQMSDGCIEWYLGPFAGEMWREEQSR